ncbi:hypothetical protein A2U01_0010475, partial [Trifolium medium]|nr:hypothetical protein [Trifolium medium]
TGQSREKGRLPAGGGAAAARRRPSSVEREWKSLSLKNRVIIMIIIIKARDQHFLSARGPPIGSSDEIGIRVWASRYNTRGNHQVHHFMVFKMSQDVRHYFMITRFQLVRSQLQKVTKHCL